MQKTIRLLSALLTVQVLLALGLAYTGPDLSAEAGDAPFLAVEADAVDRITLEGPEDDRVVLAKTDGAWRLPETDDFPADGEKVARVLERLADLERGRTVATSGEAQVRFKVSATDFERRVTLASGDRTLVTFYLGTSPGIGRAHARLEDKDAIHAVEFATYEVPVAPEDWIDKTILQIPEEDVVAIDVHGLRLERVPEAAASGDAVPVEEGGDTEGTEAEEPRTIWRATGLNGDETLDEEATEALVRRLADLRVGGVLGREEKPDYGLDEPRLVVTLARGGGETVEYRLGKMADEEAYVLKASTRPEYFRLPSYAGDGLLEAAKRDALLRVPAPPEAERNEEDVATEGASSGTTQ